jgi:5-methylcytosine-specific restriction endonuclease McrA
VTGAVKVAPNKQSELVEAAKTETEAQLRERCLRVKAAARTKEDEERHQKKLHAQRMARTYTDHDGALCLTAKFTPEVGAEVKAAIEAQADRQFEQARREGREESPAAYRADAVSALITGKGILGPLGRKPGAAGTAGAATASAGPAGTPTPDTTPAGAATGNGTNTGIPGTTGDAETGAADPTTPTERPPDPKATLSVVVDLEALRRGQVGDGERCEIPGVGPVSVSYATDLLGEALVELLIAKGTDVTTVYSAGRHIPRRVRSALLLRDPRCVVPGCDARLGLENDHWVTDYAEGGLTALDNLARLCRRHHRDRTHHGFELEKDGDTWIWIAPAHPFTPKRPRPKRKPGPRSNGKAPPQDPEPSLFDEDPPPRKE